MRKTVVSMMLMGSMLAAFGCGRQTPEEPTPQPASPRVVTVSNQPQIPRWEGSASETVALVNLEPGDMMTSTGTTPPALNITSKGKLGDKLADLSKSVRLLTWPEETEVSTTTTVSDTTGKDAPANIMLTAPASDRWYVLRVGALPAGFDFPKYGAFRRTADGGAEVRFRTGSEPRVRWVEVCEKGGTVQGSVVFSERVNIGSLPSTPLSFGVAGGCAYAPPAPAPMPEKDADTTRLALDFTCASRPETLDLTLAAGASSPKGVKLPATSFGFKANWSELVPMGTACALYKP